MSIQLKKYRYRVIDGKGKFEESVKTVLVDDCGTKYLKVLMMDSAGLIVRDVPKDEVRFMRDIPGKTKAMSSILRVFRRFGKQSGMTKAAKSFLTKATTAA